MTMAASRDLSRRSMANSLRASGRTMWRVYEITDDVNARVMDKPSQVMICAGVRQPTKYVRFKKRKRAGERAIGAPKTKTASAAHDDGALRRTDDDNPRPRQAVAMTSRYSKRWLEASMWNGR